MAVLRASQPVPGLSRRDVIEIRMCEWQLACHDILPSLSTQDLCAAPQRLWFTFVHSGQLSTPNEKGWVWGALVVSLKNLDDVVIYGGHKQDGHWVLRRLRLVASGVSKS
jgi:hypothetical protein